MIPHDLKAHRDTIAATPSPSAPRIWTACPECDRAMPWEYGPDTWHGCRYCNDEPLGDGSTRNGSSVCRAELHTEGCYAAAIARMEAHPHQVWAHRIAEYRACLDELDALIAVEVTP